MSSRTPPRRQRRTPAVFHARRYLEERLDKGVWRTGQRLPAAKALARAAGVSINTLSAALRELEGQRRLSVRRGRGIFVTDANQAGQPPPAVAPLSAVTRTAQRLRRELLTGVLRDTESLPSMKELAFRYEVCHRSLRGAVERLVAEGVLDHCGRSYRVVRVPARSSAAIACVVDSTFATVTPGFQASRRYVEFIRTLEQRCQRHGLQFELVPYDGRPAAVVSSLRRMRSCLGVIIYRSGRLTPELPMLLSRLGSGFGSLAVHDDDGGRVTLGLFPSSKPCAHNLLDIEHAGAHMGRYLVEMGHRRAVYISAFHDRSWSHLRFASLAEAFSAAGTDTAVHLLAADSRGGLRFTESARRDLRGTATQKLLTEAARLHEHLEQTLGPEHPLMHDPPALGSLIRNGLELRVLRNSLFPLFERALHELDATVWVGANDKTALVALHYLRERRVDVPGEISVVGFDDNLESMGAQLTTYNFDVPAAALAAFNHIVFPRMRVPRRGVERRQLEGVVVPRGTVRRIECSCPQSQLDCRS